MVRHRRQYFIEILDKNHCGTKLYQIRSELWKDEWIDPGENSTRVRNDKLPATVFFITDAAGKKESRTHWRVKVVGFGLILT